MTNEVLQQDYRPSERERVLLQAVEMDACKELFFEFVVSFWSVIIKEKPVWNWHIRYLCDELQKLSVSIIAREKKPYDLIINIPPGTTKSTITTIMFPAWLWTQDPTIRIITNSYSSDLSIEHAVKSRDIITSEKFRRLFPDVQIRNDKRGKSSYENTKTGARYATSTGGTITGKHAHLIINDDPLNPNQAVSDPMRKEANEHTKTLSSRKVDKENTPVVTIMQRLHEEDVTGYLLGKKGDRIKHICLPAELGKNVKPVELREKYVKGLLDPRRLSGDVLAEAKEDLGSRGYAGQYDQSPQAKGGNIIKKEWFGKISMAGFLGLRRQNEPQTFFGDTAYTDDAENDPSGFMRTCYIDKTLYIVNVVRVYKTFPQLIRFLPEWVTSNGYDNRSTIRVEPKANGISVIQTLRELTDLNVTQTPSPTESKETRLNAKAPKVECGRVVLVEGAWNEDFLDEVCGFPNMVHDEMVDLLVYAMDYHIKDKKKSNLKKVAAMLR